MSAIKNFYAEKIQEEETHLDDEYLYSQWAQEKQTEEEAEKAAFFRTFERTGTYPM